MQSQWRKTKKKTVVRNLSQADSEVDFYARCLARLCAEAQKLYTTNYVEVRWIGGEKEVFQNIGMDRSITLTEGDS